MNTAIVFDTETTGFPLWKERSDDPRQPHIVQLAAAMIDLDSATVVQSIDMIVRPEDWIIPEETSEVHGITHEMAMDVGVSESSAISMFMEFLLREQASEDGMRTLDRIGHNCSFDDRIARIAMKRHLGDELADIYKAGVSFCTMKAATPLVALPPTEKMRKAGRNHHKSPNLSEAYEFFTGKTLEGAHNAMVDVNATIDVYFGIKNYGLNGPNSSEEVESAFCA